MQTRKSQFLLKACDAAYRLLLELYPSSHVSSSQLEIFNTLLVSDVFFNILMISMFSKGPQIILPGAGLHNLL